jgi:uncharacterized protein YkwD
MNVPEPPPGRGYAGRSFVLWAGYASAVAGESQRRRAGVLAGVVAGLLVLLATGAPANARAGCPNAGATPGTASAKQLRKAIVCVVNRARASQSVPKLAANSDLDDLAQGHTRKMVRQDCFTHECDKEPSLKRRFRRSDYVKGSASFRYAEELGYESTPRQMVRRWLKRPADRGNLLDGRLEDVGVGVKRGAPEKGVPDRKFVTYTVDLGALQAP